MTHRFACARLCKMVAHTACCIPSQGSSLTFENAVGLAEELLAVSARTVSLAKVANLPELVRGMSREELALFCRALALMVFEQEVRGIFPAKASILLALPATWDAPPRSCCAYLAK